MLTREQDLATQPKNLETSISSPELDNMISSRFEKAALATVQQNATE